MGAVAWALVSAACCAVGLVLQQKGALAAPPATSRGFLGAILSKPVWLAGAGFQLAGWVAQARALSLGALVLVQPVISLQVVFALPLGVWLTEQRVGRREWAGAAAILGALAVFLAVCDPSSGRAEAPAEVWLAATGVVAALTAALALFGAHQQPAAKAAFVGTAAGVLFGYQAAVMKAFTLVVPDGLRAVATSWTSYALIVSALGGFYLVQVSLQTGALAPAIATSNAANPLASAALGRAVYLEVPNRTALGKLASFASLLVLVSGLVLLARGEAAGEARRQALPRPS
jgi:drug/metabolite transporter (DMT)-like permease